MSTREIVGHLREIYGVEVSPDLISAVTDAVLEEVALSAAFHPRGIFWTDSAVLSTRSTTNPGGATSLPETSSPQSPH